VRNLFSSEKGDESPLGSCGLSVMYGILLSSERLCTVLIIPSEDPFSVFSTAEPNQRPVARRTAVTIVM
jgi:hypothetical protein